MVCSTPKKTELKKMEKTDLITELNKMVCYDDLEELSKSDIIKAINNYQDIFERSNPFMHITSSAWIVNQSFTKILLAYHKIYQSFSWIGGHNDGEIDCLKVAEREVKEESGLTNLMLMSNDILAVDILPVDIHIKNQKTIDTHLHLNITYLFQADEKEKLIVCQKENEALQWFGIEGYQNHIEEKRMIAVYEKLNNKVKENLWQY